MTEFFNAGARVDVGLRNVEVVSHGATQLTFSVDGIEHLTFALPVCDDRFREILCITRAVPHLRAGEVYVAQEDGQRLFAVDFVQHAAGLFLVVPETGHHYTPDEAVDAFGPLHLAVPVPDPEPPTALEPTVPNDAVTALMTPVYAAVALTDPTVMTIGSGADAVVLRDLAGAPPAEGDANDVEAWDTCLGKAGWERTGVWRLTGDMTAWRVPVRPAMPADTAEVS